MGTLLTLETLRMLRAEAGEVAVARIGAVVLAAPDIDIDLFANGVERLGPDAKRITVISATNDRALESPAPSRAASCARARPTASGWKPGRAGGRRLGLRRRPLQHDLFLTNKEVQAVVKRAIARGSSGG